MPGKPARPNVWRGLPGAAIAFAFATMIGIAVESVTGDLFQSLTLSILASLLILAFESKISEHTMPEEVARLAEDLVRHPELRQPLVSIVDSFSTAHGDGVEPVVLERAKHNLDVLAQQWSTLSANRLESHFNDNRIRVAQTRLARREMLAIACDDVDLRFMSYENGESYRRAQLEFIQHRGGRVRRIFAYHDMTDAIREAMDWYVAHGVEVWAVNAVDLTRAGLDIPSMVVWDDTCASESRIPSWPTAAPTVITYYFNAADVRRVTDRWHAIKSYARQHKPTAGD